MDDLIFQKVTDLILSTVGSDIKREKLAGDLPLVGNILDSMAVTNLILALEDYFGFVFNDDDLTAESFATIHTLTNLVKQKIQ